MLPLPEGSICCSNDDNVSARLKWSFQSVELYPASIKSSISSLSEKIFKYWKITRAAFLDLPETGSWGHFGRRIGRSTGPLPSDPCLCSPVALAKATESLHDDQHIVSKILVNSFKRNIRLFRGDNRTVKGRQYAIFYLKDSRTFVFAVRDSRSSPQIDGTAELTNSRSRRIRRTEWNIFNSDVSSSAYRVHLLWTVIYSLSINFMGIESILLIVIEETFASSVLIRCFLNRCRFVKTKLSSCLISFKTSITATFVLQSSLIKYIDCWQMFVSSLISGTWYSGTFSMFSNHWTMLVIKKVVKYFENVWLSKSRWNIKIECYRKQYSLVVENS